jgi:Dehydratase family
MGGYGMSRLIAEIDIPQRSIDECRFLARSSHSPSVVRGAVPAMLYPTSYRKSKGFEKVCALITDGRFSGGS